MSAYLNTFIQINDGDEYIDMPSYSRNNPLFQVLSPMVPYEKLKEVDIPFLENAIEIMKDGINSLKVGKKNAETLYNAISNYNNPVEEKVEKQNNIREEINEYDDEIEWHVNQLSFLYFLKDMLEGQEYKHSKACNIKIWMGIEACPEHWYEEDIGTEETETKQDEN